MKALARPWTTITSPQNALLKSFRKAARDPEEFCVAEGIHLLQEALRAHVAIRAILLDEGHRPELVNSIPSDLPVYRTSQRLFRQVATTETPQGVATLVRRPSWHEQELFTVLTPLVILLDAVQDPGNVGTILRSAAALGASGAILVRGSADPFNAKALRASAGAAFHLPMLTGLLAKEAVRLLRQQQVRLLACAARKGRMLADVPCDGPIALAIGGESAGLRREILEAADEQVCLPMRANVESLNAAMAAAMALYEVTRQRGFRF